jgi:hypothetical protein
LAKASPRPLFLPLLTMLNPQTDLAATPAWAHPELRYWNPTYIQIRDCMLGEQEIKAKGETYLAKLSEMDEAEYEAYKERAVFFNMTARTVNAQVGTIFQRPPKVEGLPKALEDKFDHITYTGISFGAFLTEIVDALVGIGRYGVLVDMAADGKGDPYLRGYDTENILDWQLGEVNGRKVPIQIVLREFEEINERKVGAMRKWKIIFRVLSLDTVDQFGAEITPTYRQYVYSCDSQTADLTEMTPEVVTPTYRGTPFDYIPFQFFGAKDNQPKVDRPPAADIASLNLAHYRSYAHLEHGRFFCAMPIYYVQSQPGNEKAEYTLGPSRVWEVAQGEKPGILEFHGTGLLTLENSCQQKEAQIAAIGGRLMGGNAKTGSESDDQAKIKESNERALLLKIVQNVNEGMSNCLNWWAGWQDQTGKVSVDLNTSFLFDNLGARELRAAHQMYAEGVIPITGLHHYLMKAEVLPDWMDVDQFKTLLDTVDEFPNNPDVWAKQMGYADAANRHDVLLQRRDLRNQEEQTSIMADQQTTDHVDVTGTLANDKRSLAIQQQDANTRKKQAQNSSKALPGQVAAARNVAASKK